MMIKQNSLLEWRKEEVATRIDRILWLDNLKLNLWLIDIYDKKAWPKRREYEEIELALATNDARIIQKIDKYIPDDNYLKKHNERARANYQLIAPVVTGRSFELCNPRTRGRAVRELARTSGRSVTHINKILRRFLQGGCVPQATMPTYYQCGRNNARQEHVNKPVKKLGRPRAISIYAGKSAGKNVSEDDKENFRRGVRDFIKTGIATSLRNAWQLTKEKYFSCGYEELKDGTLSPILPSADQLPSFEQFKYYYYKERNIKDEIVALQGEEKYESDYRPTLGDSTLVAPYPGALYQIDATIGDIYLVSYLDHLHIIGRPVIYIVIDVFSRLIVGFTVTLEGPSWEGAKLAIENAFNNKVAFCREFGIEITEAQWPVEGRCEAIAGDNGEVAGYNANSLVDPFDIRVSTAPVRRPDLKPVVERNFRTIKGLAITWLPGAIRPYSKRRGKDYRLDAILDLNQFRKLMVECILHYNNSYRLEEYRMDKYMIADHVEPKPIDLWNYGMQKRTGSLRQVDAGMLQVNLLPRGEASVTPKGIRFRGVHYTCERALREQWFTRYKGRHTKHIEVLSEALVDRLHIRMKGGHVETCVLTDADSRFNGLDWYEVREYFTLKKLEAKAAEQETQEAEARYHSKMRAIIAEAKRETNAALTNDSRSNKERVQGIRNNRKSLKLYERKQGITGSSNEPSPNNSPQIISIPKARKVSAAEGYVPPARPYVMIRQAREEAKKRGK